MPVAPKNTPTSTSRPGSHHLPMTSTRNLRMCTYIVIFVPLSLSGASRFYLSNVAIHVSRVFAKALAAGPRKQRMHTPSDVDWSLLLMTPLCTSKMVSYLCVCICIQSCMFSVTQQRGAIQCGSALTFQMEPARRWLALSKNCNAQRLAKHAKKSGNLPCREHC